VTAIEALSRTLLLCRDFVSREEATDEAIVEAFTTTVVTIVADADNLRTAAAQSAVVALAGQVLGYGCRLRLVMPEVPVVGHQPPLRSRELREGLIDLAQDLIPGGGAEVVEHPEFNDFVFIIGNTRCATVNGQTWRLGGTRWSGVVARPTAAIPVWPDAFPLGALAAATCAAAEPFKGAVIRLLSLSGQALRHEELFPLTHCEIRLGSEDLLRDPVALGDLDIVSGGAIANGALHGLLRIPQLSGRIRVFEPEHLDLSNLNRYVLARLSQVGMLKIDVLSRWQRSDLSIQGHALRLDQASIDDVAPLARRVLVGTDDIPSRWFVQRQLPDWLSVGATAHFHVVASEHRLDESCVGCLHPEDDDVNAPIATVSFVSYWAGLILVARLARFLAGDRFAPSRQALELGALRTDAAHGLWWHPVQRNRKCPVRCSTSLPRRQA
jgi:hypothetical protein